MATIRESLKKLVEVAKPVPGDEQEFVAKHVIKTFDFQGKDAIHPESPYELIQKNVAAVKAPPHGSDDHGHEAKGESEAAYHVPESKEQKIAKLSMMMEATIDPKEQQLAEALKGLLADTFNLYLKTHHFHWNVMGPDFAQYHDFLGELYQEVHGAVDMIAENIRVLGELAPGNLGMPGVDNVTSPAVMVSMLLADNQKVINELKMAYSLAESVDRLGISNFLQDRLTAHEKHHWMLQAMAGIKGEEPMQEAKDVVGVKMHYHNPKTGERFHEVHFTVPAAEKFRKQHEKAGFRLVKKEAQMAEEVEQVDEAEREAGYKMSPAVRKAQAESDKLSKVEKPVQAGTLAALKKRGLVKEEDRREANDKAREERVATLRPNTPKTVEGMRHRLQSIVKDTIQNT